jgi:hypothetical protein
MWPTAEKPEYLKQSRRPLVVNVSITPITEATKRRRIAISRQRFHSTYPRQRREELFKTVSSTQLTSRLQKGGYRQFKFSSRHISEESRVQKTEVKIRLPGTSAQNNRNQKIESLVYVL